ncbi:hypothetical protein CK203_112024 [Vitis vinifera]|uniref:Uncharacterized protein n=1 Tax=Vitis vinifera TaxID=29760 RepID=A0A438CAL8_VITVI|nr:hypothetical protein CK203_112024 [Vitis vinifera]
MARLIGYLQGLSYMASSQYAMPPINVLHVVSSQQGMMCKLRPQLECSYVKAQLRVEWPSSTVQIPLNWRLSQHRPPDYCFRGYLRWILGLGKLAAEAPQALLAAPEMELEMELARVLGTAPLNQWALSFQSWLSFAVADPLTW